MGNYYVNFQNYQNYMFLSSSDTRQTLMHLFLFTNSAQRELVSILCRVYATAFNFPCISTLLLPFTLDNYTGKLNLRYFSQPTKYIPVVLLSFQSKFLGKSVNGFLSYAWPNKQTDTQTEITTLYM